ncbi:MAG: hypothetical protein R3F36_12435 [Candidatus Competibacteraceae bacterium]
MSDDPNPVPETGIEVFKAAPRPPRRRSDRQIVREYLTEIVGKLQEGWRYEEIRQELERTVGFKGKLSTLYSYVERMTREERQQRPAPGATPATPAGPETPAASPTETPAPTEHPRRRVSDLGGPGYAERRTQREREREEKGKKPKPTMIDMVNRRI